MGFQSVLVGGRRGNISVVVTLVLGDFLILFLTGL